jgi:TATA-box binding protein (TBP) (component of TFIID and TFIIIB)
MNLFDCEKFEEELASIRTEDDFVSPLTMSVCVICGTLSSKIDLASITNQYLSDEEIKEKKDEKIILDIDLINNRLHRRYRDYMYDEDHTGEKEKHEDDIKLKKNKIDIKTFNKTTIRLTSKLSSKKTKAKKKKGEDVFHNSLQMEFIAGVSRINAKVFPNGKIQIAGCRNIRDGNEAPRVVYDFINKCGNFAILDNSTFALKDVRIVMLNTKFKFSTCLWREKLKNVINENSVLNGGSWRKAIFQPNIYRGVNAQFWPQEVIDTWMPVMLAPTPKLSEQFNRQGGKYKKKKVVPKKVPGQTAVLIFRSGYVLITGAKSLRHVKLAFDCLVDLVKKNKDTLTYIEDSDSDSDSDFDIDTDTEEPEPEPEPERIFRNLRKCI